jgi:hypothetical protein
MRFSGWWWGCWRRIKTHFGLLTVEDDDGSGHTGTAGDACGTDIDCASLFQDTRDLVSGCARSDHVVDQEQPQASHGRGSVASDPKCAAHIVKTSLFVQGSLFGRASHTLYAIFENRVSKLVLNDRSQLGGDLESTAESLPPERRNRDDGIKRLGAKTLLDHIGEESSQLDDKRVVKVGFQIDHEIPQTAAVVSDRHCPAKAKSLLSAKAAAAVMESMLRSFCTTPRTTSLQIRLDLAQTIRAPHPFQSMRQGAFAGNALGWKGQVKDPQLQVLRPAGDSTGHEVLV